MTTSHESNCHWRGLHWLSWITLVLLIAGLTVIVVPGMPSEAGPEFIPPAPHLPMPAPFTLVQTWEHGWPWTFLERGVSYRWSGVALRAPGTASLSPDFRYDSDDDRTVLRRGARAFGERIAWTTPHAWRLTSGAPTEWKPTALVADGVMAIGIVAATCALMERRLRRRGGLLRWSLLDLLLVSTAIAAATGWYVVNEKRRAAHAKVAGFLAELANAGAPSNRDQLFDFLSGLTRESRTDWTDNWSPKAPLSPALRSRMARPNWRAWRYVGPQWLARLLGSREAIGPSWRLTVVRHDRDADLWSLWESRGGYYKPYVTATDDLSEITLISRESLIDDLAPLLRVPLLRRLTLAICATEEEVRRFVAEDLGGRVVVDPASQFEKPERVALGRLKRRLAQEGPEPAGGDPRYLSLESLTMNDELLQTFAPFLTQSVCKLTFGPVALSHEGWATVGRCQNLDDLDAGPASLSGKELACLSPLLLRHLKLQQGDLTVADLAALRTMPSLVALTVRDCSFSKAEQASLRAALPAVEIDFQAAARKADDR